MTKIELQPSVSMEVSRMAAELQRTGVTVFPLSVGDTHFPPPWDLQSRIMSLPSGYSHYTLGAGIIELRNEICKFHNDIFKPGEVILTPGLKQGLFYALQAIEGKKVCVLEPAWLGYKALTVLTEKEYIPINTYGKDWLQQLKTAIFDIIIICTPNNPDGKILNEEEIDVIIAAASRNNAFIITDEIYDKYDFREDDKKNHVKKIHGLDNAIIGNGLSKSHAMTGFRLGYLMVKNQNLATRINNIHQNLATCAPAISQYLALGFSEVLEKVQEFSDYYKANRNLVVEVIPELELYKPTGGFYYFANLNSFGIKDGGKFSTDLLKQFHVAVVPGEAYGTGFEHYIRLSFSVERDMLEQALLKLKTALMSYKN